MARTPLPPDLVHNPEAVERDGAILDHLCLIASAAAIPYVSKALRQQTQTQVAKLWVEQARTALREAAGEFATVNDDDVQRMVEEIARTLDNGVPQPDDDEIEDHAARLGRAMMSGWIESLAQAWRDDPQFFDATPIPLHPLDATGHWAGFWQMLIPYATSPKDNYAILQDVCAKLLRDSESDSEITLPLGLKLDRGLLEFALEPAGTLDPVDLLSDLTNALRFSLGGVRIRPAPAGAFLVHAQAGPQVLEVRISDAGRSTQDTLVLCSETVNVAQHACMITAVAHKPLNVALMRRFIDRSPLLRDAHIDVQLVQG